MKYVNNKKSFACVVMMILYPLTVFPDVIHLAGEFYDHKPITYHSSMRLTQVLLKAKPTSLAFREGLSFERHSEEGKQKRTKLHLLQQLKQLQADGVKSCKAIYQALKQMPVTGRMRLKTTLDGLFLLRHSDPLMTAGDAIYLPRQPQYVTLFGWAGHYRLPFKSNYLLTDYLAKTTYSNYAEKNYVYAIEPNGKVSQVNIAYWNRQTHRIAPGSIIYVPVAHAYIKKHHANFNLKMAQFLSTQHVP